MSARHPRARAEVYQYRDPGHREHGTWSFQVIDRPWDEPMPDPASGHIIDVPGDQVAYPSWRAALDAARAAVVAIRAPRHADKR